MRIVFMGTPEFAVTSLERLFHSSHQIAGIVTVPDKPQGRGKKVQPSPVKQFCLQKNLGPIFQPENLKDPDFLEALKKISADAFIVVAFRMLPEEVFAMPPRGTINLHASLLPYYRGAAPINWVIIRGEKETGVTTFFIEKGMDTGKILLQKKVPLEPDETAGTLHDKLAEIGADLVVETLNGLEKGVLVPKVQPPGVFPKAPKITKELQRIDWNQPAEEIRRLIHGLSPYPAAFSFFRGMQVKFYRAAIGELSLGNPGEIVYVDDDQIHVIAGDRRVLIPLELQMEGKRRISIAEAIRGYRFKAGERFEK